MNKYDSLYGKHSKSDGNYPQNTPLRGTGRTFFLTQFLESSSYC